MASQYFFSLDAIRSQVEAGGSIKHVTSTQVPGLVNISFSALSLKQHGSFEPIWHPNAQKIGYCLEGSALITMRTPIGVEIFTVKMGDVFFIPQGTIHGIENTNSKETHIHFAYSHIDPETMRLSNAIGSLSENVFNATFNPSSSGFLEEIKKSQNDNKLIKILPQKNDFQGEISSRFKYSLLTSSKPVLTKGGYLQIATKTNLPILESLGILRFGLNEKGNVEPHWHTNAGELVYIVKGQSRITILDPAGNVEVLEVNGGQGAFAPASYFHNIENIGKEEVEVIAFFSHAEPDYIGIGEVMGAYSHEVLAAIFDVSTTVFDTFKKPHDPL